MATWVEDIVQALENLGGQGSFSEIAIEIQKLRKSPLNSTYQNTIRERIFRNSSDSKSFKDKDLFRKVSKGVWALRENQNATSTSKIIKDQPMNLIAEGNKQMDMHEYIADNGLFEGQEIFRFSLKESIETITNLLQTIKQYRDYANPDDETWFGYIRDLFSTFGFNTENLAPRLIGLHDIGTKSKRKALVCIVGPKENFQEIAYGVDWKSYLFYASRYYGIDWVILTNGLQFNVLNFSKDTDSHKSFQCELDEIIKQNKTDSFLTLYKVIIAITQEDKPKKKEIEKVGKHGKRVLNERHFLREDFWTQLLAHPKTSETPFSNKKVPGVESYLMVKGEIKGIFYTYIITKDNARVELYIDNANKEWNKNAFDKLFENKDDIEKVFGDALQWDRLEEKRASLIRYTIDGIGLFDQNHWAELHEIMIKTMINFEKSLSPHIKKITK